MDSNDAFAFQARFFDRNPRALGVLELFEHLPDTCLYVKDERSRFTKVNAEMLAIYSKSTEDAMLSQTDRAFHPPALAEAYIAEDREVMSTRQPISNRVWLVPDAKGSPRWYVSSKVPLLDPRGEVIGIAGVMYPVATPSSQYSVFGELFGVVNYLEKNFRENISIKSLAKQAGMSSTRFNQLFRSLLKMTPTETLLAFRVEEARRLLSQTDWSMSRIAIDSGFYDQSHFTHRFQKATGMTPRAYRKKFRG